MRQPPATTPRARGTTTTAIQPPVLQTKMPCLFLCVLCGNFLCVLFGLHVGGWVVGGVGLCGWCVCVGGGCSQCVFYLLTCVVLSFLYLFPYYIFYLYFNSVKTGQQLYIFTYFFLPS